MSKYFKGFKISADGEEFGKVDLAAFASTFSHIECGEEMFREYAHVLVNGSETYYFDEDGNIVDGDGEFRKEIMSYEIVDIDGYRMLSKYTNEIVYYIPETDMYIWGITHFGISWENVLTEIPIDDTM